MNAADAGGGCRRRMQEEDAGGGCRGRMQQEEEEEGEERRGGTVKKQNLHQGVRKKMYAPGFPGGSKP